jgi:hypothetical protein
VLIIHLWRELNFAAEQMDLAQRSITISVCGFNTSKAVQKATVLMGKYPTSFCPEEASAMHERL